jgi:hypothetical protein
MKFSCEDDEFNTRTCRLVTNGGVEAFVSGWRDEVLFSIKGPFHREVAFNMSPAEARAFAKSIELSIALLNGEDNG